MRNLLFYVLTTLIFTEGIAQKPFNLENEISEIVALSLRLDKPDSLKMDTLRQMAKASGNKRLLAYNDFVQKQWEWRFGNHSAEEKDRLEAEIDHVADKSPYLDLRGHAFFWKGIFLFGNKEYAKSLPLIYQSKKLLEEAHYELFPHVLEYYKGFFNVHYYFEDYQTAAFYCEQALKEPETDKHSHYNHYNNLGMCYLRMKEYDKAEPAFLASIEACRQQKNESFEVLVRSNNGNLQRARGNYKAALPYYYEDIRINEKKIPESAAFGKIDLAYCLIKLDSLEQAKRLLAPLNFEMPHYTQPGYNVRRFEALSLYYSKVGDFKLANLYKDSLLMYRDSVKVRRDYKKLVVFESSLQAEKYMSQRKILENERFWLNIITLVLVFVALGYWFFQKRKHERILEHQKQLLAEEKRQRTEILLEQANQQLTQYVANIKKKNDLIERISQELEATASTHKLSEADKARYFASMQNTTLLTEADWSEFKHLFEQVFPSFFILLEKNYPELNPAELRLLALEKLTMPDKDRGAMLAISPESVKKSRYRLRKKYPELLGELLN